MIAARPLEASPQVEPGAPAPLRLVSVTTVEDLIEGWVLWQRARGLSDKTITERAAVIRRVPRADELTPTLVDRYLTRGSWAKSTHAAYHGAIRAWCRWLIVTGRRADDPTVLAPAPKVRKGRPRPIANEHPAVLLVSHLHRRTRAMILLGAYAGLRVSEIAGVRGQDVDLITNTVTVVGKGGKRRDIPLHPVLVDLARTMPPRTWWFPSWTGNHRNRAGGPMLGNSVSACISNAMSRVGVQGTPHALRHWFGSALRQVGVDSLVIKELMGHESVATTAIYIEIRREQEVEAVDNLPNLASHQLRAGKPESTRL